MFKKLFRALFMRKKEAPQPKVERRPAGTTTRGFSSAPPAARRPSSDNPLLNPLHPLNPANPIYETSDDDCRRRSHEPVSSSPCSSSSSWNSSDSGSSSSSDSGSSCSSSSD
ncbi:hypothetical protein [Azotobacter chroococcum]|uniref:hypothetical protein n=1 Tax=Azotobacter chroococcum TaxID=353 RepID=UPI000B61FE3C|nr:hypothetical protein [Azotobacter chroococcum]ASL26735.1 hypothetical protein ACG10_10845 [Azotobacter chroococcum]